MKTIGIVANLEKPNAISRATQVAEIIRGEGGSVYYEEALAALLGVDHPVFTLENIGSSIEALVVLGGDGTIIRTFRGLSRKETPLLGINLGGLGFLTEVRLDRLKEALVDLIGGRLRIKKRSTLDGYWREGGGEDNTFTALNDVVIGKGGLARVLQMEASVNDEYLTSYMADGLIIATPTGSTAYSLSAQGPIISPETDAFLLNPICPHTLTNRPIILGGDRTLRIKMLAIPDGTFVTIDGQMGFSLKEEDEIIVRKGRQHLHLLTAPGISFYGILRSKLNWGGRTHYQSVGGENN
ncbi:MAG: NAD(+)/NADH kinase [Candidatus Auribacterota bacterium]|nr:NAD(+)/NADH kinase [Candidatus Auribacterota bacterium]